MVEIDVGLVRRLVGEQFPQWRELPVRPVDNDGWDNRTFRLGERMSVRLPSADGYSAAVEKEQRWLPVLAPRLPLPIPTPIGRGVPSDSFSRPWSIYGWIDGDPTRHDTVDDLTAFGTDLADFLTALWTVDATDGPAPGAHNFHRGGSLDVYDAQTRAAVDRLGDTVDGASALDVWESALAAKWTGVPVWLHGDFGNGNLLTRDGRLSAVIDFGTSAVGDPACDLVIAWTFLDAPAHAAFADRLGGADSPMWARARGWAIWKALIVTAGIAGTNSPGLGRSPGVIEAVIADHRDASPNRR
ncbi:aminoglycoside phosphotransferase family protein [Stackebrandtia soli]|uniref:aminoglycoside phosphotransferase family protein n=1 Tax=Stackebrandtia soli TaxID=1892856 RepID=UPI0039EA4A71